MSLSGTPTHSAAPRATAMVLIGAAGWAALLVLTVAGRASSVPWWTALALLGAAWMSCRVLVRDIAERDVRDLDEYELQQRHQARNIGYGAALVAALLLYVVLAVATQVAERGEAHLLAQAHHLVLVGFLPAAALPSFWLTWQLRSRTEDD